jgi:hypothetical protein
VTHQTGDTQLAVFDLENQVAYVSYPSPDPDIKKKIKAYARSPIKLNLAKLFAPF